MKFHWKIIIPAAVVAALAAILFIRMSGGNPAADASRRAVAPLIRIEPPKRQNVTYSLHFTADILPIQQAGIFAKVTGTLEKVYVDIGTEVRRGALMAQIDTTELVQQYQQAQATFENAKINYRRSKELAEQNLVARQEADNAEAALKVAQAAFDAARTRLSYAYITAPFAGSVTKRYFDPGTVVSQSNTTLFTLMNLDRLKIIINVLERDIPRVTIGKEAGISVDAFPGKHFTGKISRSSEAVDLATRTMAVEIDIDNADHTLRPGMYANVDLAVEVHTNAITVPTVGLLKDDRGPYVFIAAGDTARRMYVQPGLEQGEYTEINSGLGDSVQVITTGQQLVRDRGPVSVQK